MSGAFPCDLQYDTHCTCDVPDRETPFPVIVLRFCSAEGSFGRKQYVDFRTGELFPREYFLVRGEDTAGRGFRRSPTEPGPGFIGDASVDLSRHVAAEEESKRRLFGSKCGGGGGGAAARL